MTGHQEHPPSAEQFDPTSTVGASAPVRLTGCVGGGVGAPAGTDVSPWVEPELPAPASRGCLPLEVEDANQTDQPAIELRRMEDGSHIASFMLELASVRASIGSSDQPALSATVERSRQEGWSSLLSSLEEGQLLRIVHQITDPSDNGAVARYRLLINGEASAAAEDEALELARRLHDDLRFSLNAGARHFQFRAARQSAQYARVAWPQVRRLLPVGVAIDHSAQPLGFNEPQSATELTILPLLAEGGVPFLELSIDSLLSCQDPAELCLELRPVRLGVKAVRTVQRLAIDLIDLASSRISLHGMAESAMGPAPDDLRRLQRELLRWLPHGHAVTLAATIRGHRLPRAMTLMIGKEVWQGRPFRVCDPAKSPSLGETVDLSALLLPSALIPPLLPAAGVVQSLGFEKHFSPASFEMPAKGTAIGVLATRTGSGDLRLDAEAWSRHTYIVGETGAGKSKLLRSIIDARIAAGQGVGLLDPHGDLSDEVLANIPPERREHVVLLDFTDFDYAPGLNLLEPVSDRPEVEATFLIHNLVETFKRLYPSNGDAFGPMFEVYLTNAAQLVIEEGGTALDVPRVFSSAGYLRYLLSRSKNEEVKEFWRGVALRAGGEASLENLGPYVVSKFTDLKQPPLRDATGQRHSLVSFRQVIDEQKILIVKLSKGKLSERQVHLLGMLISSSLFAAALSRANVPPEERVPFHLVIDEYQAFLSPALEAMLAEIRKYKVHLVLAHQNLGQLSSSMAQATLANCGNKILMRLGPQDAHQMASWVAPNFTAEDLVSLPDRHAIARVHLPGGMSPSFVMRTRNVAPTDSDEAMRSRAQAIREMSRSRYCRPVADVASEIAEYRRAAFLPLVPPIRTAASKTAPDASTAGDVSKDSRAQQS